MLSVAFFSKLKHTRNGTTEGAQFRVVVGRVRLRVLVDAAPHDLRVPARCAGLLIAAPLHHVAEQHDLGRWQRCAAARHVKGGDINAIGDAVERGGLGDERERERIRDRRAVYNSALSKFTLHSSNTPDKLAS